MGKVIIDGDLTHEDENGNTVHVRPTSHADNVAGLGDFFDDKFNSQISPVIEQLRDEMEGIKASNGESLGEIREQLETLEEEMTEIKTILTRGAVKRVQRGTALAAGTITITAVNMDKAVVSSVSKGSEGYVAARGSVTGTLSLSESESIGVINLSPNRSLSFGSIAQSTSNLGGMRTTTNFPDYFGSMTVKLGGDITGTRTISGGTTDLTVKEYSVVLTDSTTLTADGPCEWQVVEYY